MRIGIDGRKIADYGIGTYIRGLLGGLAALEGDEEYVIFAPAAARTLIPPSMKHILFDAPHYSLRELISLGRAADRGGLDLFHTPHYVIPFTEVPTVVTIHDLIHLHQKLRNPLAPLYARTMLRRAVRKSRRILTVTETVKRELVETFAIDAAKIVVTPNGVDIPDTQRPTPNPQTRYFLYAGNDKPHKNVDLLVSAFERAALADVQLVLAGAPFARFASRPRVERPGFVAREELIALYHGAIALVMPSAEEGFGLPALEALGCGTAVITSSAPALVEVTGDAAMHVTIDDDAPLAAAMTTLATNDDARRALAVRGLDRARLFTWKRCASATREAFLAR